MIRKSVLAISLALILVAVIGVKIDTLINRPASSAVTSESSRYLIESVPVGGVLVAFEDFSYLRITDKYTPGVVFRSPLYSRQYLDMRAYEDSLTVGVVWVDFFKAANRFVIRVPEWKEHWLNIFISNTPYEVYER